jgi:hypothetical protein
MRHYIKRQVMQLLVDPSLDAFGLQQAVSNYYWSEIVPVLERIFDELSTEGVTLRLDRLELDLGMLTEISLRKGMKKELYDLLRAQLQDALSGKDSYHDLPLLRESAAEQALRQWWYYMEHGRLHWGQGALVAEGYREVLKMLSVDHAAIGRLKEAIGSDSRLLMRVCAQHPDPFLETLTGILVTEKQGGLGALAEAIVEMCGILERMETAVAVGRKRRAQRAAVLRDALRGWRDLHPELLALTPPGRKAAIWRWVLRQAAALPGAFRGGGGVRLLAQWFWEGAASLPGLLTEAGVGLPAAPKEFFDTVPAKGRSSTGEGDQGQVSKRGQVQDGPAGKGEERQAEKSKRGGQKEMRRKNISDKSGPVERGAPRRAGEDEPVRRKAEGHGATGDAQALRSGQPERNTEEDGAGPDGRPEAVKKPEGGRGAVDGIAGDGTGRDVAGPDVVQSREPPGDRGPGEAGLNMPGGMADLPAGVLFHEADVDEEGMYIANAGVILLHPFLATCFSRLQWWGEGRFADEAAREKAVFLLYWLATGSEEAPEYALVLPKILCGFSPETVMPGKITLTEEEYAEAGELLQMVLFRWDKLKGSSVEGLREGFLQRGGKLFRRNERLILLVEGQAVDVLLDYLPWGLSVVKLPWLQEILYVEWR